LRDGDTHRVRLGVIEAGAFLFLRLHLFFERRQFFIGEADGQRVFFLSHECVVTLVVRVVKCYVDRPLRTLREYQKRTFLAARDEVAQGKKDILIVSPTGSGKSTMGSAICASALQRGKRIAWFGHRRELEKQAVETLAHFGVQAGNRGFYVAAPAQVMSYQAAAKRGEVPDADIAVLDECHHLAEEGDWKRVFDGYEGKIRIGLTATPERNDGQALVGFDTMIVAATYSELLATGDILPCEVLAPKRSLSAKQITASPVDAYLAKTPGTQALCFAPHVKAASDYAQQFRDRGVPAAVVEATTPTHIRDHTIQLYLQRKIKVICNVAVLTEGTDLPLTETIIMARNCGSAGLFIQITGRGGRPSPGKRHYTLIDLCGVTHVHGSPTEDRLYSLEGVGIRLARAMPANVGATCKVCQSELDESGRCPTCGSDNSAQMPKVVGSVDDLKPWQKALQTKTTDERAVMLGKWWTAGRLKGHKDGAGMYRYKGTFRHFPPADVRAEANRLASVAVALVRWAEAMQGAGEFQ